MAAAAGVPRKVVPVVRGNLRAAATALVLAVLTVAVAVALARHPVRAAVTSVITGAVYCAVCIPLISRGMRIRTKMPEPLVISAAELPPVQAPWKSVAGVAVVFACIDAAGTWFTFAQSPQVFAGTGIILGMPSLIWGPVRRYRQIEHRITGECSGSPGSAGTQESARPIWCGP